MPRHTALLWLLTIALLILDPVLNLVYWDQVLKAGMLPPDGDAIIIPIISSLIGTLIFSPIALGVTWLCLRRYNPATRLLTWRRDRRTRSLVATLVFGSLALWAAVSGTLGVMEVLPHYDNALPWYEWLWVSYNVANIYQLLALRAALIDQKAEERRDATVM